MKAGQILTANGFKFSIPHFFHSLYSILLSIILQRYYAVIPCYIYSTLFHIFHKCQISNCPNATCGSPSNAYCHSDACPLNGLYTDTSQFDWTIIDQELMQKYELFPDTANASNYPLVTIEFRLSRPCGLLRDSYVNRNKEIGEYYNVQQCNFQLNGSHEHVLYYPTKFKEVEYKVYKQNDYLGRIHERKDICKGVPRGLNFKGSFIPLLTGGSSIHIHIIWVIYLRHRVLPPNDVSLAGCGAINLYIIHKCLIIQGQLLS